MANGRYVNITTDITTNDGFRYMIEAMERPDLAEDPRFALIEDRVVNREALTEILAEFVATFEDGLSGVSWTGSSYRCGSSLSNRHQLNGRRSGALSLMLKQVAEGDQCSAMPWRFAGADAGLEPSIGYRGRHNREVLKEFLHLSSEIR